VGGKSQKNVHTYRQKEKKLRKKKVNQKKEVEKQQKITSRPKAIYFR